MLQRVWPGDGAVKAAVAFTKEKLEDLKLAHAEAVRKGERVFEFIEKTGQEPFRTVIGKHIFDTAYTAHMIPILEDQLNHPERIWPPNREGKEGD